MLFYILPSRFTGSTLKYKIAMRGGIRYKVLNYKRKKKADILPKKKKKKKKKQRERERKREREREREGGGGREGGRETDRQRQNQRKGSYN